MSGSGKGLFTQFDVIKSVAMDFFVYWSLCVPATLLLLAWKRSYANIDSSDERDKAPDLRIIQKSYIDIIGTRISHLVFINPIKLKGIFIMSLSSPGVREASD